jgi:hypothetical protein
MNPFKCHSHHRFSILILCITGLFSLSMTALGQLPRPAGQAPDAAIPPSAPIILKIRVEGNEVTAEIRNAPLQQVLEELAARSGVVFEIQTQQDPIISIVLSRADVAEAIQRILSNTSNTFFYFDKNGAGQSIVKLVRIFPRSDQPEQPSTRFIGIGKVTKSGEEEPENPEQAAKILAESKNLELRQKAVEVLAAAKGGLSVQALTKALDDPAPEIRAAAIDGLAGLGSGAALPQIVNALKDKHPGVRQSAIAAVALLGDAQNVKDLKPLSKDRDASVAMAAEMAIRKLSSHHP